MTRTAIDSIRGLVVECASDGARRFERKFLSEDSCLVPHPVLVFRRDRTALVPIQSKHAANAQHKQRHQRKAWLTHAGQRRR